jgi:hypothetical protein
MPSYQAEEVKSSVCCTLPDNLAGGLWLSVVVVVAAVTSRPQYTACVQLLTSTCSACRRPTGEIPEGLYLDMH